MKRLFLTLATASLLSLSVPSLAAATSGSGQSVNDSIWLGYGGRFSDWRPIARDELIVWTTRSKPYLVKIWRPSTSLRFVQSIGFSSLGGRVTHFDHIYVDGQRLPIKSIVALDKEEAELLRWQS